MACLPSLGNSNPNDARRFDGVQAGGSIESIAEARSLLSIKSIIGYSAHSLEEALQAERAGADLILLAPIYSPYSKRVGTPPLGASALGETARKLSIPLFALGGVSLETVGPLAQSGATGIAAITSFLPDPRAASFDANEVESKASRIAELWFERRIAHRVPA